MAAEGRADPSSRPAAKPSITMLRTSTPGTLAFSAALRHDRHVSAARMSSNSERKLNASCSPSLKQRCAGERSDQRGGRGQSSNAAASSCCRRAVLLSDAVADGCAGEADAVADAAGASAAPSAAAGGSSLEAAALVQLRSVRFRGDAAVSVFVLLRFVDQTASEVNCSLRAAFGGWRIAVGAAGGEGEGQRD